jgi:hypothetical protein
MLHSRQRLVPGGDLRQPPLALAQLGQLAAQPGKFPPLVGGELLRVRCRGAVWNPRRAQMFGGVDRHTCGLPGSQIAQEGSLVERNRAAPDKQDRSHHRGQGFALHGAGWIGVD